MKEFIEKVESLANEKIFVQAEREKLLNFIQDVENANLEIEFDEKLKFFLQQCSVKKYYELESSNILIRFSNLDDLIKENLEGVLLKYGFFIFADNSAGNIYFIDLNKKGTFEVFLGARDLLSDEEGIIFYKNGIQTIEFSYDNIKKMSIKIAGGFYEFLKKIIDEEHMDYDVVQYVIRQYSFD